MLRRRPALARRLLASVAALWTGAAWAQKSASEGIAEYRQLLADGNPAELFEMKGEELWKQKRGPKSASSRARSACASTVRRRSPTTTATSASAATATTATQPTAPAFLCVPRAMSRA